MKINQKLKDEVAHLELSGDLDFHSSPDLREKLQDVFKGRTRKIVVSLKKVSYIDSSGLATFVELLQKMKRAEGILILAELVPAVRSVFEIAKLDKVFTLVDSENEALRMVAE
jgi:anti-sigma B factor antagonist